MKQAFKTGDQEWKKKSDAPKNSNPSKILKIPINSSKLNLYESNLIDLFPVALL